MSKHIKTASEIINEHHKIRWEITIYGKEKDREQENEHLNSEWVSLDWLRKIGTKLDSSHMDLNPVDLAYRDALFDLFEVIKTEKSKVKGV